MTAFDEYKAAGWALCDIPAGSKGPLHTGWNLRGAAVHGRGGLGLCHAYSGTCSIDIDDYPRALEWLATKGIDLDALLADPRSVQIISGRVNRAKLLYRLATPLASLQLAPYKALSANTGKEQTFHALELRCATRAGLTVQDVLPPTIHPDTGKPYIWVYGDEAFGHWSNLPQLPSAMLALWQSAAEPIAAAAPVEAKGADLSEMTKLLEQMDPDGSYVDWLKVGMALHHETKGGDDGFTLWNEWSARGEKYKGVADLRPHWKSFNAKATNPVTLGALRREQVATVAQFEIVKPEDVGEDTRPEAILRRLLETRLVFVSSHELYFDLAARGGPWLTDRGIRHLFCPQMPVIKMQGKNGKPDKAIQPDPVEHLKTSMTKTVVDMVGMHPGAGRFFTEDGVKYVNQYVPENIVELTPLAHEKEAFAFLWSRMKDPVFQSWLMKFYAYALQHPGVKIQSAPLLVSAEQGTGKNTLMKVLPEILFGSRYVRSMSGSVLAGQFNGAVGQTWWLYLEELRAGANKVDRAHTTNKIKGWITDNTLEVHKKGLEAYDIRNRVQITATTNFEDALQLDNNDRRWAIGEMLGPLSAAESMDLYAFLLSERAPGVLRHIFRRVDTSAFKPAARAPETMAKRAMVVAGIGGWESKLVEMMANLEAPFDRDVFRLKEAAEAMMGQGVSTHLLGRMLKRHPFNCQQLPNGRKERLWAWRNIDLWWEATEGERLQHITKGWQPQGWSNTIPAEIVAMSAEGGVDSPTANIDLIA